MADTKSILWRGFFNVIVDIVIFIPIILFYFLGDPTVRGFFCNDESLRHPYLPSTIPAPPLYFVGFALPLITIAVVEMLGRRTLLQEGSVIWGRYTIPSYAVSIFFIFVGYLFGTVVTQCLTDVTKYTVGRQRPHFFAVCNPDFESLDCGTEANPIYVTNYVCRGNKDLFGDDPAELQFRLKEARISFVSGHSSFSFQIAVFLVVYLQARAGAVFSRKNRILIIPFFQFIFITAALVTAISRVRDFKHHPGDVIAGGLLGTIVQILNTVFVMKLFKRKPMHKIVIEDDDYPALNGATASSIEDGIAGNSQQHFGANIPAVNFFADNRLNAQDEHGPPL